MEKPQRNGLGGLRDSRAIEELGAPLVFIWLFWEGRPTELLQWLCLWGAIAVLSWELLHSYRAGETHYRGVVITGLVGLGLMLLEDTLNIRHWLAQFTSRLVHGYPTQFSPVATATEVTFYSVIGAAMLLFLMRGLRYFSVHPMVLRYLIFGYCAYAVASVASATRHIGGWYVVAGSWIVSRVSPAAEQVYDSWLAQNLLEHTFPPLGFWVMDLLIEETIELLGASAIFVAIAHTRGLRLASKRTTPTLD